MVDEETVETVPNLIALSDTGLKPGVNDRSHFQTFEPKPCEEEQVFMIPP